jgi:anti-anti-sigma regulatory factor
MPCALDLPAELTIYTVADARPRWLAALDASPGPAPFRLGASSLREIDGAGVQLVASLERALRLRSRALHVVGVPPALRAACEGLGLARLLDEPEGDRP